MVTDYNKDTHATLEDLSVIFNKDKVEIASTLSILGVSHVETFRPADKRAGRPNNLYLRKQAEQAMRHIQSFQLEED